MFSGNAKKNELNEMEVFKLQMCLDQEKFVEDSL